MLDLIRSYLMENLLTKCSKVVKSGKIFDIFEDETLN